MTKLFCSFIFTLCSFLPPSFIQEVPILCQDELGTLGGTKNPAGNNSKAPGQQTLNPMCWTQHPIAERSGAACGFRLLLPATAAPEDLDAFHPSGRTGLSSWFQSWLIPTQYATWG